MIVILTALQVEHDAVHDHLTDVTRYTHEHGTVFEVGRLTAHPHRRIALGVTGPGAANVAALTERAYSRFSPAAMLFVGIAGGLRGWLDIGDVIVVTKTYAFQGGRSEDSGFLARPAAWEISHAIEQVARRLPRDRSWLRGLPAPGAEATEPSVHFEAVAVSDVVLNSRSSPLAERLRTTYNDAVAVEMESSGFALAAHRLGKVPVATVRAISDRADGTKAASDSHGGQRVAARNAAAFAVALAAALDDLDSGDGTADDGADGTAARQQPRQAARSSVTVRDNATVGQLAGINDGVMRYGGRGLGSE